MFTHKAKLIGWLLVLGMVLACVPSLPTPMPPPDPGAINTFIAQTVNAASSQTAAAMPTSTSTPTSTPTPRNTDTPTPTFTSTVIFILFTPTPLVIPTFTVISSGGGGGSSSDNYACQVLSVSPANGTTFGPRADFDAVWRVKNIGQKAWDRTSVDYRYTSGDKIHKVEIYDLSANVPRNGTTDVIVDMVAPRNAGTYSTTWNLYVGSKSFCNMTLRIVVR
ncbi:MAG TPA: NBR1-Ig-like domain-containing protein [Anaerolineales bacterium]|nr:NBR1-Ig-like domain-containing protein [Anaerolineales bacterium]